MDKALQACQTLPDVAAWYTEYSLGITSQAWLQDALNRAAQLARNEALQYLLDNASGGGSWRRVATQMMDNESIKM